MGTEVYPFRDMQVVDYGDIPCNPFNIPKVRREMGQSDLRKVVERWSTVDCELGDAARQAGRGAWPPSQD